MYYGLVVNVINYLLPLNQVATSPVILLFCTGSTSRMIWWVCAARFPKPLPNL